jgi:DNA gyrase/topoisomerase IV subunit B
VAREKINRDRSRSGSGSSRRKKKARTTSTRKKGNSGKLRIGNHWNAITIIALSQNNPLKAIAEFVENSIDARARNVTIIRGRERGELYLKVIDDGEGIPLNEEGLPNFRYVATHICDSLKKRLKERGVEGIQGEFGIGLLSFWTVGERLLLSSAGADGKAYQMEMKKGESGYAIHPRRILFSHPGTELMIHPLLPGIRQLNGERIQHYLASELRDRIRRSGVRISIKDRYSRKELEVKPREYTGRLLHDFEVLETDKGDIYLELYLNPQDSANAVSLYRSGTRVRSSLSRTF